MEALSRGGWMVRYVGVVGWMQKVGVVRWMY